MTQNKLIVILGPTASGKTGMSVRLAKKFNGEIISADSRQIYKGMNVGSGKVTKKEMLGIPHHLLDVANPKNRFSVVQYQKLALRAIKDIQKRNKLPILVGGTGFYIQSIVDGIVIPEVKPDWALRAKLEKIALPKLLKQLQALDPVRAGTIDQNNFRRVVRALEIVLKLGKPVPTLESKQPGFNALQLGIAKSPEELKKLIHKRLIKRLVKNAMINEVKKLHNPPTGEGVSWKRLEEFGLEYRFVAQYIQGKITKQEMISAIQIESEHYAKRQMTWFKRDKSIHWIKTYKEAERLIKNY
jgi:tRNA dimethylallyltransferase